MCLPSDASRNIYHLTWVSLTLDVGYLFTAAPAKCSHCCFPWTRGISSQTPLLTLNMLYRLSHQGSHLWTVQQKRAGCDGPRRSVAERRYPSSKVRGGGREELPHAQRSGAAADRSNPMCKERWVRWHRRAERGFRCPVW